MEDVLVEISNDHQTISISRTIFNGVNFYQVKQYNVQLSLIYSAVFIDIEDAWNAVTLDSPDWYNLNLNTCNSRIGAILKNDYFKALVNERPNREAWLTALIGYGIHWL